MITHVIFDLDGTLSDTALATEQAFALCAPRFGFPLPAPGAVRRAMGYACPEFHQRVYPDFSAESLVALGKQVDAAESGLIRGMGPRILFDGIIEMLEGCREKGCLLYIASTGSPEHVGDVLDTAGIRHFFTSISSGQPEKVVMVRDILAGGDPAHWLMLGDKAKDSTAARENGIFALGAGYGYVYAEERAGFDAIAQTPADVLRFLST